MESKRLISGDFVNVVRGRPHADDPSDDTFGESAWVGHVGIILLDPNGTVNMIHSAKPAVREESLRGYIAAAKETMAERDAAGKPRLLGFKFLRLREAPWANLRELDGPAAPRIYLPDPSDAGSEQQIAR